jgi:hypothetical protein
MVSKAIALLLLVVAAQSLYTSSYWAKRGVDVRDQVLE